ncbi:hypothetical protein [Gimesia panareensis]|nr:hypothetical protein [Gimesia panareensis]
MARFVWKNEDGQVFVAFMVVPDDNQQQTEVLQCTMTRLNPQVDYWLEG